MLGALPAGYSAPFSTVTATDHSAWVIIATAVGLACVLIFTFARIIVRYSITQGLGQDDYFLAAAVVRTPFSEKTLCFSQLLGTRITILTKSRRLSPLFSPRSSSMEPLSALEPPCYIFPHMSKSGSRKHVNNRKSCRATQLTHLPGLVLQQSPLDHSCDPT